MFSFPLFNSAELGETTHPLSLQTGPCNFSFVPNGRASVSIHLEACRCGGEEGRHGPKTGKEEGGEVG